MSNARDYQKQMIHYLRKTVVFGDDGVAKTVGEIPAGALILKALSGVAVQTVFNAGTTNTLNIGTSADDNLYATLLALGALAFVPCDEAVGFRVDADTTITATVVLTGTAATTGEAEVVIAYIPDNDG
tara:strand:+ start:7042 stop:7425 length:384 start_codon:yes stop_codon:yes gene_type:complete